jgi:hypothetical protein
LSPAVPAPLLLAGTGPKKIGASPLTMLAEVDRPNGTLACLGTGQSKSRRVATKLAGLNGLMMIVARRKNTAWGSDLRLRDCSRKAHE